MPLVCQDNLISPYVPVNSLQPFKFLLLFEYLQKHAEISRIEYLEQRGRFNDPSRQTNLQKLRNLKSFNKNYSGQFIVGEGGDQEVNQPNVNNQDQMPHTVNSQLEFTHHPDFDSFPDHDDDLDDLDFENYQFDDNKERHFRLIV